MLDKILDLVKDQAAEAITNNSKVPAEKRQAAVETTTSTIVDSLKDQITPGNISNVLAMFGGNSSSSNALSGTIQNSVVSALTGKVGLSKAVATTIAATVVPALFSLITKKNDDPKDSFDLGSILGSLTGGDNGGGILGTLGKLFGGK